MHTVELTWSEINQAVQVAVTRQLQNLKNSRRDAHGAEREDGWGTHIVGAVGEMAVAKFVDVYWNGNLGKLNAPDVGPIEVRTRTEDWHSLILHKSEEGDSPNAVFVMATVEEKKLPKVKLNGIIRAEEGQKEKFWDDPAGGRPAYFVPQEKLYNVHHLKRIEVNAN